MSPRPLHLLSRRTAERAAHECAVRCTRHLEVVPSSPDDFWSDLRRGRRRIYGGILTWIDRAHAIGTPLDVVLLGLRVVWHYAHERYGVDPHTPLTPTPPAAPRLRAA